MEFLIRALAQTSRDIWARGWAEAGAGNISVRVDKSVLEKGGTEAKAGQWVALHENAPELGGESLLMTASGSLFRVLADETHKGCGLIEIDQKGEKYRIVQGFEPKGRPSSEMPSHIAAHKSLKKRGHGQNRVVIHVHAPNLVAVHCALSLDTTALTKLLWGMHSECVALFPEGIEVAPWRLPGSPGLSEVTARGFSKRRLVVWPFHGVIAAGRDLDEAFGLIEVGEKAAELFLLTCSLGGAAGHIGTEDLKAIATGFGVEPDMEILRSPMPRIAARGRA